MLTKPLEPFLRTKKWIEDNPPPPVLFNPTESAGNADVSNQQRDLLKNYSSSHLEKLKTEDSNINSFRECFSGKQIIIVVNLILNISKDFVLKFLPICMKCMMK